MIRKVRFFTLIVMFIVCLTYVARWNTAKKEYLVYSDSLDEVAVTVDGKELTLRDLAFYVAFEESKIEEEAYIYNPDDTTEYWKIRIGNDFVRVLAKDTAMEMAVRDEIFYELALEDNIALDDDERKRLKNSQEDFWSDLDEAAQTALGLTREEMDAALEKEAIAEKYELFITETEDEGDGAYSVDGEAYEEMREEHVVTVNDKVWDRIFFGEITTSHNAQSAND